MINFGPNFPKGNKRWTDGLLKGRFFIECCELFVLKKKTVIPAPTFLFDASKKDGSFIKSCPVTADKKEMLLLRCEAMLSMLAGRAEFFAPLPKKLVAKKIVELEPYVQHVKEVCLRMCMGSYSPFEGYWEDRADCLRVHVLSCGPKRCLGHCWTE